MKKISGVVVILAVLVLGSFYITGILTERKIKDTILFVNRTKGIYVEITNYDRSWFKSKANLVWHFQFPNKQTKKMETADFKMPLTVYHGPVMLPDGGIKIGIGYAHTIVQMPAKNLQQMKELFTAQSTAPTLDLSLFVNIIGQTSFNLDIPGFNLIAKQGDAKLNWHGLDSSIKISRNMASFKGFLNIAGFNFSRQNIAAKLDEVKTDYNIYENNDGLFLGGASLTIPSLVVREGEQIIFELSKFGLKTNSTQDAEVINSSLDINLDKVVANNQTYGPGTMHFEMNKLDSKALARINKLAQQGQAATNQEKKRFMLELITEVPKLLSRGAQIKIDPFSFKLPNGKIEGNLFVSLPQGALEKPFSILRKIEGDGQLSAPAYFVKEAMIKSLTKTMMNNQLQQVIAQQNNPNGLQQMNVNQQAKDMVDKKLRNLVDKGVLKKQGNDYKIAFALKNGKLLVNGEPFKPAMMQF